jgi:hypothetical protein
VLERASERMSAKDKLSVLARGVERCMPENGSEIETEIYEIETEIFNEFSYHFIPFDYSILSNCTSHYLKYIKLLFLNKRN